MKTDYYDLLGVEPTATEKELKKAYRQKALLLHPDKNPDDIEAANQRFSLVRAAYEVLSDEQERSWYDSHKSSILRDDDDYTEDGELHTDEMVIPSVSVDEILRYFNPALYTKLDNSKQGFYEVASQLFERLACEEVIHGKALGLPKFTSYKDDDLTKINVVDPSVLLYTRLGNSHSDYANQVRKFYLDWSSFLSVKSFNWKDEYRYSQAPDRRTRRVMEKENKKARDLGRKEFNETVRSFVLFIKKRDPRVKIGQELLEKQRKKKQQQELEEQAKLNQRQQRVRRLMESKDTYKEQDWQQLPAEELRELEKLINEEYDLSLSDSSDSEFDDFEDPAADSANQEYECIICDKVFKNINQFEVHETSNKHKKLLKQMQWEMRQEGIDLGIDKHDIDLDEFETASSDFSEDAKDEEENVEESAEDDKDDEEEKFEGDTAVEEKPKSEIEPVINIPLDDLEVDDIIDSDVNSDTNSEISIPVIKTKSKKKKKYSPNAEELDDELSKIAKGINIDSDDDWSLPNKKKDKKKKKKGSNDDDSGGVSPAPEVSKQPKVKEAALKIPNGAEKCSVCDEIFLSRNKLFQHVKASGHAAPIKDDKKKGKKKNR